MRGDNARLWRSRLAPSNKIGQPALSNGLCAQGNSKYSTKPALLSIIATRPNYLCLVLQQLGRPVAMEPIDFSIEVYTHPIQSIGEWRTRCHQWRSIMAIVALRDPQDDALAQDRDGSSVSPDGRLVRDQRCRCSKWWLALETANIPCTNWR